MALRGFTVLSIFLAFVATKNDIPCSAEEQAKHDLIVFTVATEENDGFRLFMKSAKKLGYHVKVLGMGTSWKGGDVDNTVGGAQKINLLKNALAPLQNETEQLVLFVDSYDLVFAEGPSDIIKAFQDHHARVLFSAEDFCWPDESLTESYPVVKLTEKRYLNSGGFMGYAADLYAVVAHRAVKDDEDDQLYYSHVYLDRILQERHQIKLDVRGDIFQNLNGALDEVRLKYKGGHSYLYNVRTGSHPMIVHGNGPIKSRFYSLANYLTDRWTPTEGCKACSEDTISLVGVELDDYPKVLVGIFLESPIAFATEFFENIANLNYPKNRMHLYIHYQSEYNQRDIREFMDKYGMSYEGVALHSPTGNMNEWQARNKALEECSKIDCKYFFNVDGDVQITNPETLLKLIEKNRTVIAPMMIRPGKMWTNFWGSLAADGFYRRSDDYVDIVQKKQTGQWNVPYMTGCYLMHGTIIPSIQGGYIYGELDSDMAISQTLRNKKIFMYLDNMDQYGLLVNNENVQVTRKHADLYEMFENRWMWEQKYIHSEYKAALDPSYENEQPCPDVYWFPIVSPTFAKHLIEETEHFGQWSGGGHKAAYDARLDGGYENVPTVDIHMNQIGWENHWLTLLRDYVGPLNQKVFTGYYTEAKAIMNFVVRYRPKEQDRLKPHHDSSTYSINIALNKVGEEFEARATMSFVVRYKPGEQDRLRPHHDASTFSINIALNPVDEEFEGGGTGFIRQKCQVTDTPVGWMSMFPGRLTHLHEGLPITKGTRYIMVSFVDP